MFIDTNNMIDAQFMGGFMFWGGVSVDTPSQNFFPNELFQIRSY